MSDRFSKIDRWVSSSEEFKELSWHDVSVHGFATTVETLVGLDGEPVFESQQLLFDLDYILNWHEAYTKRQAVFWISPATLVFEKTSDLKFDFKPTSPGPLIVIYTIERKGRHWGISMDNGEITFESTGFKQYFRREPTHKTHLTCLSDSERGGLSFRRQRD